MGVRIVVGENEPIRLALQRFKKLLWGHGVIWEQGKRDYFIDETEVRRAKRFQKRFKAREATFLAKRAGEQPVSSLPEAHKTLWERTGKPP